MIEQAKCTCSKCGQTLPGPVEVIIPASVEKQILDRVNQDGRAEVRLLEEGYTESGYAWNAEVTGWENPQ